MHASAWDIVQQLYQSEINVGLQADFDGGIAVWIGGPLCTPGNAILASRTFGPEEFEDVAAWLDGEVRRLFPNSTYARNYARNSGDQSLIALTEYSWRAEHGRRQGEPRKPGS